MRVQIQAAFDRALGRLGDAGFVELDLVVHQMDHMGEFTLLRDAGTLPVVFGPRRLRGAGGRFLDRHAMTFGQPLGGGHRVVAFPLVRAAVREFEQITETLPLVLGEGFGDGTSPRQIQA